MRVDALQTDTSEPFDTRPAASVVAGIETRPRSDAPFERVCDRLCLLVTRLLDVSAAVVSLREEDRVLPVGLHGLNELHDWGRSPLSISLSGHTGGEGE